MKFTIYKACVIYGGGSSGATFEPLHKNVTIDFVRGFFSTLEVDSNFKTKEDSMGCYYIYKTILVSL